MISSLGDYLTANGGRVNLKQVDVIMSEVGEIEDEVFKRRKQAEIKDQVGTTLLFLLLLLLLLMLILLVVVVLLERLPSTWSSFAAEKLTLLSSCIPDSGLPIFYLAD